MFARKIDIEAQVDKAACQKESAEQKGEVTAVDGVAPAANTESPARALQEQLKQRLEAPAEMSARRVAAMFLVVCLSCWLAGIGLYSLL